MALSTGTAGVVQKDYQVYIAAEDESELQAAIATYLSSPSKANANAVIAIMKEVGELRKDSIDMSLEDGDTVEGNTVGELVMNKQGEFVAELINTTADNIAALEALDRKSCTIVMREKDSHVIGAADIKTVILINKIALKYSEKITGGDIARSTITLSKKTPTASAYRHIADVDYS